MMSKPAASFREVLGRDGRPVRFDRRRITKAVLAALGETGRAERSLAQETTDRVVAALVARHGARRPGVEEIQDQVEQALVDMGLAEVARAYVLYRRQRASLREAKQLLGVRDELKLPLNAVTVLKARYLRRDQDGQVVESTGEMMERVARHVAAAEEEFTAGSSPRWAEEFGRLLRSLEFLPNSPTLMNAGTRLGLLSGCFVLPVEDSLRSIFTTLGTWP